MADSSELKRKYIFFEIIGRAVNKTASIAERSFEVFSFASKLEVVYHDDNRTTREGFVLPIKRASVEFQYTSRLTHELLSLIHI